MKLTDPSSIQNIFNKILSIFPECLPYEGKYGTNLDPHLSVGKFTDSVEQSRVELPSYKPLKFTVTQLHIMFTDDEMTLPWKLYKIVFLGK